MKDFICVSCWGTFQVDGARLVNASSVACPTCGASQPVTSSVKAAVKAATQPAMAAVKSPPVAAPGPAEEGGATMEIELPTQLASELKAGLGGLSMPSSRQPPAPRTPKSTDRLGSYKIAGDTTVDDSFDGDGDGGFEAGPMEEGAATMEMQLPAGLLEEMMAGGGGFGGLKAPTSNAAAARPQPTPAAPRPEPAPAPPQVTAPPIAPQPMNEPVGQVGAVPPADPIVPSSGDDTGPRRDSTIWRMRMRSGLVLSFPTFDMVAAWAADKPAEQISISLGNSPFKPYEAFLDALDAAGDPAEAIAVLNGEPRPVTDPAAVAEVVAEPTMSTARSATIVTRPTSQVSADAAAAAAAAAAARRAAGKSPTQLQPQFKFRTTEQKAGWPKLALVGVALAVAAAAAAAFLLI